MAGKLPTLPGEYPTLNDWENHLTTIFPEVCLFNEMNSIFYSSSITCYTPFSEKLRYISFQVRLKRYLEMRGADGGPWRRLCALPAFWVWSFLIY